MKLYTKAKMHEYYHARNIAFGQILDLKSPKVQLILDDLAEFCRATKTTFHPDARVHAVLEGRREVYLRIQDFLTLNAEELMAKYAVDPNPTANEET